MFFRYRKSTDRAGTAKIGGLLLASAMATAAFGADAPPPPPDAPAAGQCQCRGHDVDLAKMQEHATKAFDAADTNHDGKISLDEFIAFKPMHGMGGGPGRHGMGMTMGPGMAAGPGMHRHGGAGGEDWMKDHEAQMQQFQDDLFKALDADHDNQISQAEFAKAADVARSLWQKQMFAKLDTNHDGSLEKDEFPPFAARMSAMDTNNDGTVSRDEMKAAHGTKNAQTP